MQSTKNNLSSEDLKQWLVDLIVFNLTPVVLVFLTTLQSGNYQMAFGAAYTALIAALINLVQKYKSGSDPSVPVAPIVTPLTQPDVQQTVPQVLGGASGE